MMYTDTNKIVEMYTDKVVLAPMVRINSLPMRLLALDQGRVVVVSRVLSRKLPRISVSSAARGQQ